MLYTFNELKTELQCDSKDLQKILTPKYHLFAPISQTIGGEPLYSEDTLEFLKKDFSKYLAKCVEMENELRAAVKERKEMNKEKLEESYERGLEDDFSQESSENDVPEEENLENFEDLKENVDEPGENDFLDEVPFNEKKEKKHSKKKKKKNNIHKGEYNSHKEEYNSPQYKKDDLEKYQDDFSQSQRQYSERYERKRETAYQEERKIQEAKEHYLSHEQSETRYSNQQKKNESYFHPEAEQKTIPVYFNDEKKQEEHQNPDEKEQSDYSFKTKQKPDYQEQSEYKTYQKQPDSQYSSFDGVENKSKNTGFYTNAEKEYLNTKKTYRPSIPTEDNEKSSYGSNPIYNVSVDEYGNEIQKVKKEDIITIGGNTSVRVDSADSLHQEYHENKPKNPVSDWKIANPSGSILTGSITRQDSLGKTGTVKIGDGNSILAYMNGSSSNLNKKQQDSHPVVKKPLVQKLYQTGSFVSLAGLTTEQELYAEEKQKKAAYYIKPSSDTSHPYDVKRVLVSSTIHDKSFIVPSKDKRTIPPLHKITYRDPAKIGSLKVMDMKISGSTIRPKIRDSLTNIKGQQKIILKRYSEKMNKKLSFSLSQTMQQFCVDASGINRLDTQQGWHKLRNWSRYGTGALTGTGYLMTAGALYNKLNGLNVIGDFENSFRDLRLISPKFNFGKFSGNNISQIYGLTNKYFMQKYSINLAKMSDKNILAFLNSTKGLSASEREMLSHYRKIFEANKFSCDGGHSLKNYSRLLMSSALGMMRGTDAYDGGMLLYRSANTVKSIIRMNLQLNHMVVSPLAKKAAVRVAKSMEENSRLGAKIVTHVREVKVKKENIRINKRNLKDANKAARIKRRKDRNIRIKKYLTNKTRIGRGLTTVSNSIKKRMAKVASTKAGLVVTKGYKALGKSLNLAKESFGKLLSKINAFALYAKIAIAVIIAIYVFGQLALYGIGVLGVGFFDSLGPITKKVVSVVSGVDLSTKETSKNPTEKQENEAIVKYIKRLKKKNDDWYDSTKDEQKKSPKTVNGSPVIGGDNPETGKKSEEIKNWTEVFYESYNGNAIGVKTMKTANPLLPFLQTEWQRPYFIEGENMTLFDTAANTKAIFALANSRYQGRIYENYIEASQWTDKIFNASHVISDKCSEVYQCGGCKTLIYSCRSKDEKKDLSTFKDSTGNSYGFLESDDKGKIDNHDGEGCTAFYCNPTNAYDKKSWKWKTAHYKKYGCKKQSGGFTEQKKKKVKGLSDEEKELFEELVNVSQGGYLTKNSIKNIVDKYNKKVDKENKKIDDALNSTPSPNSTPAPNVAPTTIPEKKNKVRNPLSLVTFPDLKKDGTTMKSDIKSDTTGKNVKLRLYKGKTKGYGFDKDYNIIQWNSYTAGYCPGHYGCPGNHKKKYCMGHVDLTVRFAAAGLGKDEYNGLQKDDNGTIPYQKGKLFNFDKYKYPKSFYNPSVDEKAAEDDYTKRTWSGWTDSGQRGLAYDIYNSDWEKMGFPDYDTSIEAGEFDQDVYEDNSFDAESTDFLESGTYGEAAYKYYCDHLLGAKYSQSARFGPSYDCSSSVYTAYKKGAGIDISYRGSSVAASEAEGGEKNKIAVWTKSSKESFQKFCKDGKLQCGDLIFFTGAPPSKKRYLNINHVAMYGEEGKKKYIVEESLSHGYALKRTFSERMGGSSMATTVMVIRPGALKSQNGSISKIKNDGKNIIAGFDFPAAIGIKCKSNMDYSAVTSRTSRQYKLLRWNGHSYTDQTTGLRIIKCSDGDRVAIAMGSYFVGVVGAKFDITFQSGETIKVVLGDVKRDSETNKVIMKGPRVLAPAHSFHPDGSIVEFITGNASTYYKARRTLSNKKGYCFLKNDYPTKIVYRGMESSFMKAGS